METMLIVTDFSSAAHKAFEYGVQLAHTLEYRVVLLNVYSAILSGENPVETLLPEELKEATEGRLNNEVASLKSKPSVPIEIRAEEGVAQETIQQVAIKLRAKWIIAGMKGSGKTKQRIFGSTIFSLIRNLHVPLIVIPESAFFTVPSSIALASDIDYRTNIAVINPLEEFGVKYGSTMYVVRVIKKGMDDLVERLLRPSRLKWHFKELHPSFEFLNDNDVTRAMNKFVKDQNIDIVAMIANDHGFFERVFAKSNVKEMLLQVNVPLIILPNKLPNT